MRIALILLSLMLAAPAVADAASVAYIENGEVWVSSLDGLKKARLSGPVVNASGETENWLAVAASDGGRIVAVRNKPGGSRASPGSRSGSRTARRRSKGRSTTRAGGRCRCIRSASTSRPTARTWSNEEPTLFGSRVIAKSGSTVVVQSSSATTYGTDFVPWLDLSKVPLDVRRTDVAANGTRVAGELEEWNGGTQTIGRIAVLSIAGVDAEYTPGAVDCLLPAIGIAKEVSLSQDGRSVAWTDDQGLKVGVDPSTTNELCTLAGPPAVIAAGGRSASIGGGDVSAFLPVPPTPVPPTTSTPPATGTQPTAPALPAKVTAKALTKGLTITVGAAGKVTVTVTVGGKKIGTGSATAKGAGKVTIKLKLTKAGRKLARKGKKVKLKVTQGGRSVTKTVKLG